MAIKEILGFVDLPAAARYPTISLMGKGILPTINPGPTSAFNSAIAINGRNWLRIYGNANPSCTNLLSDVKITQAELRGKKIFGGFRYVIQGNAAAKTASAMLTVTLIGSQAYDLLTENDFSAATDEVYIEYCIDLQNDTMQAWIDGVLKKTQAVVSTAKTTATDARITYGQNVGAVTNENHCYNDFYWLIDTSGTDALPSKRLGPLKVKSAVVDAATLPQDWTITNGFTAPQVLDATTLAPTTELTPVIRTSAAETVASVGFAKPTVELSILAVSIEVFGFRDTGTAPTIDAQVKQGVTLGTKQNYSQLTNDLKRGAASDKLGCFNLDLNGQKWTADTINDLEVLINSKTGS